MRLRLGVVAFILHPAIADTLSKEKCLSFDPILHLPNTTLRVREYINAQTTIELPGMDSSCNRSSQRINVASCRIALTIPTSNRSSFIYEHFFLDGDSWTGRILSTGNGGIDGCIKYDDIAYGLESGFAVIGTNNGHNGTGGALFLDNPDVVIDFSWRALHTATETAKVLTDAFYGEQQGNKPKSYYMGCSGGGRQGIQAANLFPNDYDGILVGAPALNFNYMSAWRASFYTYTGAINSSEFIAAETWKGLIHEEVLKQCDELDGVRDGILVDPSLCAATFRPEALLCGLNDTTSCLTAHQIEVVRKVFSPLYGINGEFLYPSLAPGAEVQATQRLLSGEPFPYSVDWFRYAVFSDPDWNPASWNIRDAKVAEELNPGNARTWPSDLSPLRDNGGKLLIYHGGADQQITGFNTERWYNYLSREMEMTSETLDKFVRFFRVPGMGHCSGGNGAWQIGQSGTGAKNTPYDAKHNVLLALIHWVESGNAPDTIAGTRFVNDNSSEGVALERWHCRYPLRSTYTGGKGNESTSWTCQ